jgi:hypothetical protein
VGAPAFEQAQPDLAARGEGRHGLLQPRQWDLADEGDRRGCSQSATSVPVNVAPTITERSSSTTKREVSSTE